MFRVFNPTNENEYIITKNSNDDDDFEDDNIKNKNELTRKICCLISLGLIIISIVIIISCIKDFINHDVDISSHVSTSIFPRRREIEFIKPSIQHIPITYSKPIISSSNDEADKFITNKYVDSLNKLINDTSKLINSTQKVITNTSEDNINDNNTIEHNKITNNDNNMITKDVNNYSFTKISKKYNIVKKDDKNITVDEETNIESNIDKNEFTDLVKNIVKGSKVKQLLTNNTNGKVVELDEDGEEIKEE